MLYPAMILEIFAPDIATNLPAQRVGESDELNYSQGFVGI
jgi:hypothetical protein